MIDPKEYLATFFIVSMIAVMAIIAILMLVNQ